MTEVSLVAKISHLVSLKPFPEHLAETNAILTVLCSNPVLKKVCAILYFSIFGHDPKRFNETRFQVLFSLIDTLPAKSIIHFSQIIATKRAMKFDYGPKKNLVVYGTEEPPEYNYSRIPAHNLVLISGLNDPLATRANVEILKDALLGKTLIYTYIYILTKNNWLIIFNLNSEKPLEDYIIPDPEWTHSDPILGIGAYQYCHSKIIDLLRKYAKTWTKSRTDYHGSR